MRKKLSRLAKKILVHAPIKVGEKYGEGLEKVGRRVKSELEKRKAARQPSKRIDYKRLEDLTPEELKKVKERGNKSIEEIFKEITEGKKQFEEEKGKPGVKRRTKEKKMFYPRKRKKFFRKKRKK